MSRRDLSPLFTLVMAIAVLAGAGACKPRTREFKLHGQIVQSDAVKNVVVVKHNDIPGFMPGMTMPYKVKDRSGMLALAPGDVVDARVVVYSDGSDFWLDNIRVTDSSSRKGATPPHTLKPGEKVPDLELTNQDGKKFHLSDLKGKAVLVTFIYTRCPLPNFCPRLSTEFSKIQEDLAKNPDDYAHTHLLTISFDPDYDTPAVLRKYGMAYLRDDASRFSHWDFATTSPDDLHLLSEAFGLIFIEEDNQISHSMNIVLISPEGTIVKSWPFEWTRAELEDALRTAVHSTHG
jgi:protein SCO1